MTDKEWQRNRRFLGIRAVLECYSIAVFRNSGPREPFRNTVTAQDPNTGNFEK